MTPSTPLTSIDLDHCTFIGRGANRVCVEHPVDPQLCIKIDLPAQTEAAPGPASRLKAWAARLLPADSLAHRELASSRKVRTALGQDFGRHFAEVLEIIPLNLGFGLVCQRIYNADGTPARSVDYYLRNPSRVSAALINRALDEFEVYLLAHDLPLFDLNAGNILIQFTDTGARAICIDSKSLGKAKELLPLANWVKFIRQKKISRRFGRLRNKVSRILDQRENTAPR